MSLDLIPIQDATNKMLEDKKRALPADFNQTRFVQNSMAMLGQVKDIEKASISDIVDCLLKGAFLGLDFYSKECYAIFYGGKLKFQTDYKGDIKIVKRYAITPILDIYAKLVREGDDFDEQVCDGRQTIEFKPRPFNTKPILGAFAVVLYKEGLLSYETMSSAEIEQIRAVYSKSPNSPAWINSRGEMYRKTVLRRLIKRISVSFESFEQESVFNETSDCEFVKKPTPKIATSSLDAINLEVEK